MEEKSGEVEEKSGLCNVTFSVKGPETRYLQIKKLDLFNKEQNINLIMNGGQLS